MQKRVKAESTALFIRGGNALNHKKKKKNSWKELQGGDIAGDLWLNSKHMEATLYPRMQNDVMLSAGLLGYTTQNNDYTSSKTCQTLHPRSTNLKPTKT